MAVPTAQPVVVSPEHLLIFQSDHARLAQDLMLWQMREKPRLEGFVAAMAAGAQLSEHTIWSVIVGATTIQGAEGASLDRWGELVGEFRGGLDDEQYTLFIDLRIRVNTKHPSEDAMYTLIADAVAPYTVEAFDLLPNGIQYLVRSIDFIPDPVSTHIASLVQDFRPAGVITPIVETVPAHMKLDWEDGGTIITNGTGGNVVSKLIYSGRIPGALER